MTYLYPLWLWLIPVWLLLVYFCYRKLHKQQLWEHKIDAALQPFMLTGEAPRGRFGLLALTGMLAIVALAGPAIHKQSVPLYETRQALVVALDLSASMLAEDIAPNRLQQARFALSDILRQRQSGYTALVVFAAEAFAVSPLTDDVETIFAQLTHMSPAIMPAQGSRLDKAIMQAVELLQGADYRSGHILLITDGLSDLSVTRKAAVTARKQGYTVSVLAVGTEQGAQIPIKSHVNSAQQSSKEWLLDAQQQPVIARLDKNALQSVAKAGDGLFELANNPQNIRRLLDFFQKDAEVAEIHGNRIKQPENAGIWLLFPLLALVLYQLLPYFKQSGVFMIPLLLLTFLLLPAPQAQAFDWHALWQNPKQQAKRLLFDKKIVAEPTEPMKPATQKSIEQLAGKTSLQDSQWQGMIAYRLQQYPLAIELFSQSDSAEAWYNRGNALAQSGAYDKAIDAYETALQKRPGFADALYNLQVIQQALQAQINAAKSMQLTLAEQPEDTEKSGQDEQEKQVGTVKLTTREKEQQAYETQWLKSIPDDPSGLWRRKFYYQYQQRGKTNEVQPW